MNILACYSSKGGVGKTATSVNLAHCAARSGLRTLLIDLDPQGASSFYFRVAPSTKKWASRFFDGSEELVQHIKASDFANLDILPATLAFRHFDTQLAELSKREQRLRRLLKGFRNDYDLIVLDCPPSIGQLAESVFAAADIILVPVVPTTLSERTFDQLVEFLADKGYPVDRIVPFFSMVQARKTMHQSTMAEMKKRYPTFLRTSIPCSADVEKMGEHRAPVASFAGSTQAAKAYGELWTDIARRFVGDDRS
jgi:chromosome partitioning protein